VRLKDLGEFGLINHLTRHIRTYDSSVVLGIGDDAAAFRADGDGFLLVTCDMLVEGRHFILDKISPEDLGYKALAVSFSDIAAMAGLPRHAVISAGWPEYVDLSYTERLYNGVREAAESYSVNILGGDTVKAPQLVLDVTVIGESKREPVTRTGARPGHLLAVTGRVGAAAAGLDLLLTGTVPELPADVKARLITAHVRPLPRVREAAALAEAGAAAMIDISDGLASEVNHICAGSGTGAVVYAGKVPLDADTVLAAEKLGKDPLQWALFGGEDYELLVALPADRVAAAREALSALGVPLSVIGEIMDKSSGVVLATGEGVAPLSGGGYDHFGGD
jgi:thiamine-monophosphate kinase